MKISTASSSVNNLIALSPGQLEAIRKQLDRYFFTAGVNVALLNALERSQPFQTKLTKALILQIFHLAQLEKIFAIMQVIKKQEDELTEQVRQQWLPLDQSIIGGKQVLLLFLLVAGDQGGQSGLDKMVPQFNFKLVNTALRNEVRQRLNFLIEAVDQTSIEWVARMIRNGLANNLSATEIVKILRQEAATIAQMRSELIVEHELMTVMNLVEMEVFKRNGIQQVFWRTSQDERVEEICLVNEAAGAVDLGKEFPMGQVKPPAHQRCRCYLLPVLPHTITGEVWRGQ